MNVPFFYFEVWRGGDNKLCGNKLSFDEYVRAMKRHPVLHSFTGRTATIAIISETPTITRNEKLDFAIQFMAGKLINVSIDLNTLNRTITAIVPPP